MEKYEDEVDPLARVQVCLVFVYFAILIRRLLFEEEKKHIHIYRARVLSSWHGCVIFL